MKDLLFNNIYQRVEQLRKDKKLTKSAFAERLGVPQNTYSRYTKSEDNEKLALLLWRIIDIWPDVSRNWIFFNEGEMYGGAGSEMPPTTHIDVTILRQVVEILEEHLRAVKGKLTPVAKAEVVAQLYELVVEKEMEARDPMQMLRLVMGALAKASNE